jgi:tetratricopeptide (TPR) repeat protein
MHDIGIMEKRYELPKDIADRLDRLSGVGNDSLARGDYRSAYAYFSEMWSLLPEPKTDWNASTWILTSLGDVCFQGGKFDAARQNLEAAILCPNAIGNPFIHLRLGQTYYELGLLDAAANELMRAYMGGGREIFSDDAKYLEFLSTRARLD